MSVYTHTHFQGLTINSKSALLHQYSQQKSDFLSSWAFAYWVEQKSHWVATCPTTANPGRPQVCVSQKPRREVSVCQSLRTWENIKHWSPAHTLGTNTQWEISEHTQQRRRQDWELFIKIWILKEVTLQRIMNISETSLSAYKHLIFISLTTEVNRSNLPQRLK